MTLGEGASRARLQVTLEADRLALRRKFNRHYNRPRTVFDGMTRGSAVVPVQTIFDVGGDTDVMPVGLRIAAEDIDEALSDASHDC